MYRHKLKLAVALFLITASYREVKGQLDQICVSLGNVELDDASTLFKDDNPRVPIPNFCTALNEGKAADPGGTIGASKYRPSRYGQKMLSIMGLKFLNRQSPCLIRQPTDGTTLQVTAVKDTAKNYYPRGWLSFGIDIEEKVHWLLAQVADEDGNAIGEFIEQGVATLCGEQNFPSSVKFGKPQQFLPCSAAGPQEPRVAQAVVHIDSESINAPIGGTTSINASLDALVEGKPITEFLDAPEDANKLKMRFLWRLNEYYCNRHEKFRFVVFFLAGNGATDAPLFVQSDWLYPKWFGVADVVSMEGGGLECLSPFSIALADSNYWINHTNPSTPENDNWAVEEEEPGLGSLFKSCRTYLTRTAKYRSEAAKQPSFGGRCETKDAKKFKPGFPLSPSRQSSVDVPHDCKRNPNATYPPNMESYTKYLAARQAQWEQVCNDKTTTCPTLDAEAIKNATKQMTKEKWMRFARGRYIKRTRAYHGLTMSWAFFFFVPISNFVARYFKETFLDWDVLGLRLWTVIHIGGVFWAVGMIATALTASFRVSYVYGYSWSPVARKHVIMGWVCIGMFILTAVLGPVRPLNPKWRSVVMVAHGVLGFSHYIVGFLFLAPILVCLIISSTIIPGSPSASICYRNIAPEITGFGTLAQHQNTLLVIIWLGLDIMFHIVMNRIQSLADHVWDIRRTHWFPLTPIVRLDDTRSYKYFRYRTFFLLLYIIFLLTFMGVLWRRLYSHDWLECDAGPMTCTHRSNSGEDAYPETICGRMAQIRAWRKANNIK